MSEAKVARIAAAIEASGMAAPALALRTFTADELGGAEPPPRSWHVRDMLPGRAVTLMQADGGAGKSTLAIQLAAATVLGGDWLGQQVRKGNALYLSAEDDRDEVHRRLDAVAADLGVGLDSLSGLKVVDLCGQDAVLAEADRTGRLHPTGRWSEFVELARGWSARLVVIDNLADVFAGEENSRPQARQFVGQLQGLATELGAGVLLIGHPSLAGMASGTGSSGSTAWNNSVRSRLYLTRPEGDDDRPAPADQRILTVKKANYGPANLELRLRWSAGVFKLDGEEVAPFSLVDRSIAEARVERVFLELLDAFEAQGRIASDSTGRNYAPHLFAKDPRAEGITKRGFEAAMNRLFASGRIRMTEVGRGSHARRKIAREAA